jgi:hypothetical protein
MGLVSPYPFAFILSDRIPQYSSRLSGSMHQLHNNMIANPNHSGLGIRKAIAVSSRGDRCVSSKLKDSGSNGDRYYFSIIICAID